MSIDRVKRHPASLALRVTVFVGIATTLVFFAFGWFVQRSLEHHFADLDAGELKVVAASVQRVLQEHAPDTSNATLKKQLAGAVTGHHGIYFNVADVNGTQLYTSPGPDFSGKAGAFSRHQQISADTLKIWEMDRKFYRGDAIKIAVNDAQHYTLVVASSMDAHLQYIEQFKRTLWITTILICGIAFLTAWMAVKQGHAPIRKISQTIRGITSEQLHVRLLPEDVPIELAGLVASFNDMLARIEDGFRQLSNFSGDIAHELRTPVTNLTTETQVALSQERDVDEYREILYSNLEEFERMGKMIGDMLFLAQTDNDLSSLNMRNIDLATEVAALFDYFEAWAEDRQVSFKLEGSALPIKGDQLMLRRALGNLLSNAIRYTPHTGTVTVTLARTDRATIVSMENPGDEIAAEHLPKLFDRFYRVDPSRQRNGEGAGLGLAIVKSIVEAHRGTVRVLSEHGITCFEITFPNDG